MIVNKYIVFLQKVYLKEYFFLSNKMGILITCSVGRVVKKTNCQIKTKQRNSGGLIKEGNSKSKITFAE